MANRNAYNVELLPCWQKGRSWDMLAFCDRWYIFAFFVLSFCVYMCLHVCILTFLHYCVFEFSNRFCLFLTQGQKLWHVAFLWHGQSFLWTHTTCQKYQRQDGLAKTHISINSSSLYVCEISINRNVLLFQVPTHTPVEVFKKVLTS